MSNVLEWVCAPPVLTTTPGVADVVAPVDVEAALDPDPVEGCVLVEEPVVVFADPEPDAPLVAEPLADEPDEFEEAGWAQAIP
jgi:hypothetical protein